MYVLPLKEIKGETVCMVTQKVVIMQKKKLIPAIFFFQVSDTF